MSELYKRANIETMTREQLLMAAYDGLIVRLKSAGEIMSRKEGTNGKVWTEESHLLLSRAREFIAALINGLNLEVGGVVAQSLHSLYFYYMEQLAIADVEKDPKRIYEVLSGLIPLREAFAEAARRVHGQAPQQRFEAVG